MSEAGRFAGKTALVTGAASGIGLATAQAFGREGANVVLADRNLAGVEAAVAAMASAGCMASGVGADVASFADCIDMVAHAVDRFGGLDIAVNNAGIPSAIGGRFDEVAIDDWRRIIDTNLSGVFLAMKAEVPALRARGGGAIVNTASVASIVAAKGMPAYVAAKHGVAGLTKAAALDLIDEGVRVNAVCPGFVGTPMLQPLLDDPALAAHLAASTPIGRVAAADEIAAAILFLASDAGSYCVGTLLTLDGGVTLS